MSQTTVCFLLSSNPTLLRTASNLISEMGYEFRPLADVEAVNLERLLSTLTGCIIVDADSHSNGISQLTSLFVDRRVSMPIIITSAYDDASKSNRLHHLRQGAFETLKLPEELDRYRDVVRSAISRDTLGNYPASAMRIKLASLTARERETLGLFLRGHNTKVVAKALDITYQTVDKHRGRALRKIGVGTVVELQNQIQWTMLHSMGLDIEIAAEKPANSKAPVPLPHFPMSSTSNHTSIENRSSN